MKYLVAPELVQKINSLTPEELFLISKLLKRIEKSENKFSLLSPDKELEIKTVNPEMYVARADGCRVYFVIEQDASDEENVLLLDISEESSGSKQPHSFFFNEKGLFSNDTNFGHRLNPAFNPSLNPAINPNLNPAINPNLNPAINPNLNPAINPNLNPAINPNLNPAINPNLNPAINPNLNPAINPNLNPAINPNLNSEINPNRNRFYGGPFIYSNQLNQTGFTVKANANVTLFFDGKSKLTGFGVIGTSGVINTFDTKNQWQGFLVPKDNLFLRFSNNGIYSGLIV